MSITNLNFKYRVVSELTETTKKYEIKFNDYKYQCIIDSKDLTLMDGKLIYADRTELYEYELPELIRVEFLDFIERLKVSLQK